MNNKKLVVLLFVCAFNLILFNSALATTFYVKNGGNDSASGTSDSNAWKSVAKVNKYAENPGFKDGDIIQFKRGDVWRNDKSIGNDGSSVNWGSNKTITFRDYGSGEKPIFDANSFQPVQLTGNGSCSFILKNLSFLGMDATDFYVMKFADIKNITIDGVYIDAQHGASSYPKTSGILIGRQRGDLEIKNSTFKNFVHPKGRADGWGAVDGHAIYSSYLEDGGKTSGIYSIHDNVFTNMQADGIQLKAIACTTKIYNNDISNYGENAIDLKNCANVEIYNNNIHNGKGTEPGGTGGGITDIIAHWKEKNIGPHVSNITIRDNYFHDSDYNAVRLIDNGKNIVITRNLCKNISGGFVISGFDSVKITDNVFHLGDGLMESHHANALELGSGVGHLSDVTVQYNTVYGSSKTRYGFRSLDTSKFSNINIKNNLIYLTRNNSDAYPLKVEDNGNPLSFYKNTLINSSHQNRVYFNGTTYDRSEESQWRKNYDTAGLFSADPLFKSNPSSGDLTLLSSSPAIGTGTTMKAPYYGGSSSADSLEAPFLQIVSTN